MGVVERVEIDNTELLQNFRGARDKRKQIKIEADLHCCAPRVIAERLDELGALKCSDIKPTEFSARYSPVSRRRAPGAGRKLTFDEEKARKLFDAGVSDDEMASRLGVNKATVYKWIRRRGLTRPDQKQKKEEKRVKKERPVEEEICDKETSEERTRRILESTEAHAATHIRMEPPEPRAAREPRTMTVGEFLDALGRYLTESMADAPLRVNGKPVTGEMEILISVRNDEVGVDIKMGEG